MARRRLLLLVALFAGVSAAAAQDPPAPPAAGTVAGPFRAFVVADFRTANKDARNRTAKMHDLVTEYGLNPYVVVYSRTTPKSDAAPLVPLLKKLNALATPPDEKTRQRRGDNRLGAFAVFLTLAKEYPEDEQRDEKSADVRKLADQLKLQFVPFALAAGPTEQAKAWGLAETSDVTVVLVNRLKIVQTWTFTADKPPADADVEKFTEVVEAELKKQ